MAAPSPEPTGDRWPLGVLNDISGLGAGVGEPWGWVLPLLVAGVVILTFVGGISQVFALATDRMKPVFVFVLLAAGLAAMAVSRL